MRPSRLRRTLPAALAAAALAVVAAPAHAAYDDAGYWSVADRMQQRLDPLWDEQAGYYRAGSGGVEPMANSLLLLTHSVAAMRGHEGPARNDARARVLAARLVDGVPFISERPAIVSGTSQTHAPGWVSSMTSDDAPQHLVFDAEVVDGLAFAYRARRELGLPEDTVARIRSAIHGTAHSRFWRWPALRLNQVNWYALIYAADATVTGDGRLLRHDLALQLRRFFLGAHGTRRPRRQLRRRHALPLPPRLVAAARAATSIRRSTRTSCSPTRASTGRRAGPACRRSASRRRA